MNTVHLKLLAAEIYHYFHKLDNPPADEIFVPVDIIREDKDEPNGFHATVRFVTNYAGRKVHSIRVKFKVDEKGRFLTQTWKYI